MLAQALTLHCTLRCTALCCIMPRYASLCRATLHCIVMIREKAIFIKLIQLNRLNISDQQIFDSTVSSFNPSKCTCPHCSSRGRLTGFSSYQRDLIFVSDGKPEKCVLEVPRFLCNSCGHTHALLPDVLIPYGSYSLRFILFILLEFQRRSCTVVQFCEYWEISVSSLYEWIHLFLIHYNSWCQCLDRILWINQKALSSILDTSAFPSIFQNQFHFSFLQRNKTTPSQSIHPPNRRYKPHPT